MSGNWCRRSHPLYPGTWLSACIRRPKACLSSSLNTSRRLRRGCCLRKASIGPRPAGVRDLLASRLDTASETGRQLLSTAAVIGRSFDFDTLREVSGRSEEETVTALEELIAQGLVEEMRGGAGKQALNYDFSHERLRALVNEETSLARRRLLHRRVAETLVGHMRENRSN